MRATEILIEEHALIQQVLDALEREEIGPAVHAKYRALADRLAGALK